MADKAGNTAQAAKGKAKRVAGKAAGIVCPGWEGRGKKKANLKQAGEKLKDIGKEGRDGLRRWT